MGFRNFPAIAASWTVPSLDPPEPTRVEPWCFRCRWSVPSLAGSRVVVMPLLHSSVMRKRAEERNSGPCDVGGPCLRFERDN